MVKVYGKGRKQHGTPAMLLAVYESGWALVKPMGHGKEELVPLDRVRTWKSRNVEAGG